MRGEHVIVPAGAHRQLGIIPACAGSTVSALIHETLSAGSSPHARGAPQARGRAASRSWDHPRMRGEHLRAVAVRPVEEGIIPACAGSTSPGVGMWPSHKGSSPHARGALDTYGRQRPRRGDHPRMRGEHRRIAQENAREIGIIPACAGSTRTSSPGWYQVPDHPRMRGEHLRRGSRAAPLGGIIPACAGSTAAPRASTATTSGSSPHARGAHLTTCATIPHSSILDSVIRVLSRISAQLQPRCYPPNLLAARCLLALLHPVCGIPSIVASSVPSGLFINSTPSQSTGCQSG